MQFVSVDVVFHEKQRVVKGHARSRTRQPYVG